MNYEIDNTKHVKIMVIEASDNKSETSSELADVTCGYLDKGWMVLEHLTFHPNYRIVLYWPEHKSNRRIGVK